MKAGSIKHDRHPPRPTGRRPDRNERRVCEAVDEQDEARDRQQREEHLVAGLAQPADQRRAQARVRRQSVNAEKDDDADDEKRHAAQPQAMIIASIRGRRPEPVRSRRARQEAELDQKPDEADERDQHDQHPPSGFVAIVPPLDIDEKGGDDDHERKDAAEQSDARIACGSRGPGPTGRIASNRSSSMPPFGPSSSKAYHHPPRQRPTHPIF